MSTNGHLVMFESVCVGEGGLILMTLTGDGKYWKGIFI